MRPMDWRERIGFPIYGLDGIRDRCIASVGGLGSSRPQFPVRGWRRSLGLVPRLSRRPRSYPRWDDLGRVDSVALAYGAFASRSPSQRLAVAVDTRSGQSRHGSDLSMQILQARSYVAMSTGCTVASLGERIDDPAVFDFVPERFVTVQSAGRQAVFREYRINQFFGAVGEVGGESVVLWGRDCTVEDMKLVEVLDLRDYAGPLGPLT